jgi:large subunit ribosomal protein L10
MAVRKQDKILVVEELKTDLGQAQAAVIVEYRGMTVRAMHELRKSLRSKQSKLRVVKNTLLKIAVQETPNQALESLAGGPVFVAYTHSDPTGLAKEIAAHAKKEPLMVIRGGILGGRILDASGVSDLSNMPSIEEMRARVLAVFNAPAQQILGLLLAAPRNLLGVLNARADKLGETGN